MGARRINGGWMRKWKGLSLDLGLLQERSKSILQNIKSILRYSKKIKPSNVLLRFRGENHYLELIAEVYTCWCLQQMFKKKASKECATKARTADAGCILLLLPFFTWFAVRVSVQHHSRFGVDNDRRRIAQ